MSSLNRLLNQDCFGLLALTFFAALFFEDAFFADSVVLFFPREDLAGADLVVFFAVAVVLRFFAGEAFLSVVDCFLLDEPEEEVFLVAMPIHKCRSNLLSIGYLRLTSPESDALASKAEIP